MAHHVPVHCVMLWICNKIFTTRVILCELLPRVLVDQLGQESLSL